MTIQLEYFLKSLGINQKLLGLAEFRCYLRRSMEVKCIRPWFGFPIAAGLGKVEATSILFEAFLALTMNEETMNKEDGDWQTNFSTNHSILTAVTGVVL